MNKQLFWAAIAAALSTNACAVDGAIIKPVSLVVSNDTQSTLRCTAIVAHFVSSDLGRLPPGKQLSIPLSRHEPAGGLAQGSYRNQPMWLENIVCGLDDDWTASAVDIPLQQLRENTVTQVLVSCSIGAILACQPVSVR